MEQIFGGLINYETKEEMNDFVKKIDKDQALQFLETSLIYCQKNGIFTFEESYYIHEVLTKLKIGEEQNPL